MGLGVHNGLNRGLADGLIDHRHGGLAVGFFSTDKTVREIVLVWFIGDSHATKRNVGGPGPTPSPGTVLQWDATHKNLYEIRSTDILQAGGSDTWGSPFPQYGIDLNAAIGATIVMVCSGFGGSNYSPRTGETGNWTDSGALWGPARADFDDCLLYLKNAFPNARIRVKVKVIMGVNDVRGATALSNVQSDITAFYDRFQKSYPGIEIGIILPGRSESGVTTARHTSIRNYLITEARNRYNVHVAGTEAPLANAGLYDSGDNLHLLQSGNNVLGSMMARWDINSLYSKWARTIIGSQFEDVTQDFKNRIERFVRRVGDYLFQFEYLYILYNSSMNSALNSWSLLTAGTNVGCTFSPYGYASSDGTTSKYLILNHIANNNDLYANANDFLKGLWVKTNRSAAGSGTKIAMGTLTGSAQALIGQANSANRVYARANDLGATAYTTDTKFQDDSLYGVYRLDASNNGILKNGSSAQSGAVAEVAATSMNDYGFAGNSSNAPSNPIDMDAKVFLKAPYNTMDWSLIYSALQELVN